jgi:ABC-type multidrug transport system ATPase subunit
MMPEIAAFCDLGEYLDMPVRTYSNGMAMRLKFACATAFDADIILMDEWLGAGDPSFQDKAQRRLRKMVDDAGILMLASHNHTVIRKSCNKLAWLDRGKLRAFGDVEEVLAFHDEATRPQTAPQAKTQRQAEKERDRAASVEADRERRRQEKRIELKREQRRQEKRKQIAEAKKAAAEGTHATDTTT